MSFIDIDQSSHVQILAQLLIDEKQAGLSLPYQDIAMIEQWLVMHRGDFDRLLLVVCESIEELRSRAKINRRFKLNCRYLNDRVVAKLK
jgi:hypothetical protein